MSIALTQEVKVADLHCVSPAEQSHGVDPKGREGGWRSEPSGGPRDSPQWGASGKGDGFLFVTSCCTIVENLVL